MNKTFFPLAIMSILIVSAIPGLALTYSNTPVFYSDEVDRTDALADANRYPYDSIHPEQFNDFSKYNCFSLGAYNDFANNKPYDQYRPLDASTISPDDARRLRRDDYNTLANQNSYDQYRPDDVQTYGDTDCWTLGDYNTFAETKPYDQFKPVKFQSFDDLHTVNKIGSKRFHFFEPNDLVSFDLQRTNPKPVILAYDNQYNTQNYGYYQPNAGQYSVPLPYGAVDLRKIRSN